MKYRIAGIKPLEIKQLGPFKVGGQVTVGKAGKLLTVVRLGGNPDGIECAELSDGQTYALRDLGIISSD